MLGIRVWGAFWINRLERGEIYSYFEYESGGVLWINKLEGRQSIDMFDASLGSALDRWAGGEEIHGPFG